MKGKGWALLLSVKLWDPADKLRNLISLIREKHKERSVLWLRTHKSYRCGRGGKIILISLTPLQRIFRTLILLEASLPEANTLCAVCAHQTDLMWDLRMLFLEVALWKENFGFVLLPVIISAIVRQYLAGDLSVSYLPVTVSCHAQNYSSFLLINKKNPRFVNMKLIKQW